MTRVLDRFLLAMLIVDGVVVGLGSVAFCYLRFWGQPVPVIAIVAGERSSGQHPQRGS